ncbi:hypothetical protein QJS66_15945 [Kocuria rhizophila]|nr:hypothetical protein QJS66_15945 [Kocuria rhizophila]
MSAVLSPRRITACRTRCCHRFPPSPARPARCSSRETSWRRSLDALRRPRCHPGCAAPGVMLGHRAGRRREEL